MMTADDSYSEFGSGEINNERSNKQRRLSLTKPNLVLACKIDYKNLALVLLFYVAFYSFLYGFYMLLLEGVTATSSVGKQHTLLWTFFYLGIAFTVVVSGITVASQWAEKKEIDHLITGSESSLLLNEPPPPPSRDAATVASGSMKTSGEESGEEVERTLSDVGRRILAVAARRESDTSLVELANNVCERSKTTTTPQK